jgi:serine/threonine-protein kinase
MPSGPLDPTVQSAPGETTPDGDEAYCAACNQSFGLDHLFCPNDGARLVKLKAQSDALLGRVFDERYEVRAPLGHGGMGTVYRGWQRSVDREVAIKVIHPKLAAMRPVAKRFLREARLASRLNQPSIINVYDFGQTDDGILYLVMELLRGRPLARDLEAHRPLPLPRITAITLQICDALEAAHGQGIIHRDLKPHNIVILDDPPGRDLLKILDFGLAKSLTQETTSLVTQTDALLGTPLYMPPEQILGKPSDQRADLYSLGCMLYQMASGRPPFIGDNINSVLASHVHESALPLPDHVPRPLTALIQQLMAKAPGDRPASASLVRDAIAAIAGAAPAEIGAATEPTPVPPRAAWSAPGTTGSIDAPPRPRRAVWIIAGLLAAGFTAGLGFAWRSSGPSSSTSGGAAPGARGSGDAVPASRDGSGGWRPDPASAGSAPDAGAPGAVAAGAAIAADAGVATDAAVPADASARPDARPPPGSRLPGAGAGPGPTAPRRAHPLDAGVPPVSPTGPAPPAAADAGMPDLDLLPTRRGSNR